ncbi:MAG: hypothetical protein AB8D78_10320 [Akkermansiaceae bacterium]
MNPVLAEIEPEPPEVGDDRVPEILADAIFDRVLEVDPALDVVECLRENDDMPFHCFAKRA